MLIDRCYIEFDNNKEEVIKRLLELKYDIDYEIMLSQQYTAVYISDNIVLGYIGNTDDLKFKLSYEDLNNFVFYINDTWDDVDYASHYLEDVDQDTIEVGVKRPITHKDLIVLSDLTENMQDRAYEIAGEYSDDYLHGLSIKQAEELEKSIINWFNENVKQPNFGTVLKVKEISREEFLKRFI